MLAVLGCHVPNIFCGSEMITFTPLFLRFFRCSAVGAVMFAVAAAVGAAPVDIHRANDYYAALQTSALRNVEQFHMAPCEKRFAELDYIRSFEECDFILRIFPNHPVALDVAARVCERWNSPTCMLDDVFQRAILINPKVAQTYVVRGIHYYRTHQFAKAIDDFKHALDLDPNSTNAHYDLALSYLETKQFDLANVYAQKAYALGASLPGLRERLIKAGQWKPIEQGSMTSPAAAAPVAGAAESPTKAGADK